MMEPERKGPMRVLAADDSAVMREALRMIFEIHGRHGDSRLPGMELCGLASDGVEAVTAVGELKPDVLLLDLEMPKLDGLGVLKLLAERGSKLPVILCCTHTERSARATVEALAMGASDWVMKPGREVDPLAAITLWMRQLLPKIAATGSRECEFVSRAEQIVCVTDADRRRQPEIVVIAVSTGGPAALEIMLPMLPADFAAPLLIVQHMPRLFTGALAHRLTARCKLPVREARGGETIAPGSIWLAPGDQHMEICPGKTGGINAIRLHRGPALNSCTPSADYLFRSAAAVYGKTALGLVMTGMGADGVEGARALKCAGGTVLAQDEASSAVWGMPGRTVREGIAHATFPLETLAAALTERVGRTKPTCASGEIRLTPRADKKGEVLYGVL